MKFRMKSGIESSGFSCKIHKKTEIKKKKTPLTLLLRNKLLFSFRKFKATEEDAEVSEAK